MARDNLTQVSPQRNIISEFTILFNPTWLAEGAHQAPHWLLWAAMVSFAWLQHALLILDMDITVWPAQADAKPSCRKLREGVSSDSPCTTERQCRPKTKNEKSKSPSPWETRLWMHSSKIMKQEPY